MVCVVQDTVLVMDQKSLVSTYCMTQDVRRHLQTVAWHSILEVVFIFSTHMRKKQGSKTQKLNANKTQYLICVLIVHKFVCWWANKTLKQKANNTINKTEKKHYGSGNRTQYANKLMECLQGTIKAQKGEISVFLWISTHAYSSDLCKHVSHFFSFHYHSKMMKNVFLSTISAKSGKFGHQVTLDTHLQTVEIQMRRLFMSRLIRIFTVCLVNYFYSNNWTMKQSGCPNIAVCPNISDFSVHGDEDPF